MSPTEARRRLQQFIENPSADTAGAISNDVAPIELQEIEREADHLAQRLAFLSGYLSRRGAAGCGDAGHDESLKHGQRVMHQTRKALGYSLH